MPTTSLFLKMLLGALMVLAIQWLASSRHYYLAVLAPLFPTFVLFAHYAVGTTRSPADFKASVLFGMLAMLPYFAYLGGVYVSIGRLPLVWGMLLGLALWSASALLLVAGWQRWMG
ncbi:MAG: GlpM family protein [Cardiobacteriaceae bacterium]|nr:GlpM family protein [Cardiobacteriaceae bacterium]